MRIAFFMSILAGGLCGYLSPFGLFNNYIYTTMISFSMLPGVVIASVLGIPFSIGAFTTGLISLLSVNKLKINYNANNLLINNIGFILFSLGLIFVSKIKSNFDLMQILFGSPLGISDNDVNQTIFISLFILLCLIIMQIISIYPPLLLYILYMLASIIGLQSVGIILVPALLIIPGCIAKLITNNLSSMKYISSFIGIISSVLGVYISYWGDIETGASIILITGIIYICTIIYKKIIIL
jgi:manganese transport system permease protein